MAGNNIVIGSRYNPFSFQELLAPVQIADSLHKQTEEEMGALASQASVWDNLARQETDPQAHAMYTGFANDLNSEIDKLASSGLNPQTRRGLNNMRIRYGKEIVPIEQAYTRRRELQDEQRQAKLRDSSMMFDRNASDFSLDELINNPAAQYKSYSGSLIEKQVSDAASNMARELRDGKGGKWVGIINGLFGPQYYERMLNYGLSSDQVLATLMNDPQRGNQLLRGIVDSSIEGSGIPTWSNEQALNEAYNYASRGAMSAIGTSQFDKAANQDYDVYTKMAIKKIGESAPVVENYLGPTVTVGGQTDRKQTKAVDNRVKLATGVKVVGNGILTNDEAQKLTTDIQAYDAKIAEYLKDNPEVETLGYRFQSSYSAAGQGYATLGQAANDAQHKARTGYDEYARMRDERKALIAQRNQINKNLQETAQRYSHLSDNPIENIKLGTQLENAQTLQARRAYPILFEGGEQKDIIEGIRSAFSFKNPDSKIGLIPLEGNFDAGKPLDQKKTNQVLGLGDEKKSGKFDMKKVNIATSPQYGLVLGTPEGKFIINGIDDLDVLNRKTMNINDYLGNFSNEVVSAAPILSSSDLQFSNPRDLLDYVDQNGSYIGDNMTGVTYRKEDGDLEKMVVDFSNTDSPQVMYSSLYDEINGGNARGQSTKAYVNRRVPYIKNVFGGNRNRGETIPTKVEYINTEW